jgi:hypothetical protein
MRLSSFLVFDFFFAAEFPLLAISVMQVMAERIKKNSKKTMFFKAQISILIVNLLCRVVNVTACNHSIFFNQLNIF